MAKQKSRMAVEVPEEAIAAFCRRHGIRRAAIFGSSLGPRFTAQSDIDVLIDFEPGRTPGFAFFGLQDELSAILGRRVDLNTRGFLSPYIRDAVLSEAVVVYDSGR